MIEQTELIQPWYDLVSALPRALGNTLIFWSEKAMSYPPSIGFEEFKELLRSHGQALLDFVEDDDETPETYARAQEALHWVADNLGTLWD